MATPWMTSDDLISAIKRKIALPISQNTFSEQDVLNFLNEEMLISQIPSVLQYHEEYYVTYEIVPLVANKSRYEIPSRAIGMKLRDLCWSDDQEIEGQPYGNLFEMTRILPDDKTYFQRNSGGNQQLHKFYVEGNEVVLMPPQTQVTGSLVFFFYIRPNNLVSNERAAIIQSFKKDFTITNASLVDGDTLTIQNVTFTAVSGSPGANEFQIGGSGALTAINLVNAINTNGTVGAATSNDEVVTLEYSYITYEFTSSNTAGISVQADQQIMFDQVPSNITNSSYVDFLQTRGGHKIIDYDILVPSNGVSSTIITFSEGTVPDSIVIGDYVCSQYECIIPYLPTDLHTGLSERTSARILAALGDNEGLASANAKIAEIEQRQGNIIDNRVESAPLKITARHSLLRQGSIGPRRKF